MKLSNKRGSESWDPHYPIRQRREKQEATSTHVHLLQWKHIVNEWKQHQYSSTEIMRDARDAIIHIDQSILLLLGLPSNFFPIINEFLHERSGLSLAFAMEGIVLFRFLQWSRLMQFFRDRFASPVAKNKCGEKTRKNDFFVITITIWIFLISWVSDDCICVWKLWNWLVDENWKFDLFFCVPLRCLLLALMRRQARNLLVTRRNLWD